MAGGDLPEFMESVARDRIFVEAQLREPRADIF